MNSEGEAVAPALVVSMFEDLREGQRATDRRLAEGNDRMGRMETRIDALALQVKEQNGNVARALAWQRAHDDRMHDAELSAQAAAQERARLVGHVERVRREIAEWTKPVLLLLAAAAAGCNILLAAFWWLR